MDVSIIADYLFDESLEYVKNISIEFISCNIDKLVDICVENNAPIILEYLISNSNTKFIKRLISKIVDIACKNNSYEIIISIITSPIYTSYLKSYDLDYLCNKNIRFFNICYKYTVMPQNKICKYFEFACSTANLPFAQLIYSKITDTSKINISNCFLSVINITKLSSFHNVLFNPSCCIVVYDWLYYIAHSYFTIENINYLFAESLNLPSALWLSSKAIINKSSYDYCIKHILSNVFNCKYKCKYYNFMQIIYKKHKLDFFEYLYENITITDNIKMNLINLALKHKLLNIAEFLVNNGLIIDDFKHKMYDYYIIHKRIQYKKKIQNNHNNFILNITDIS